MVSTIKSPAFSEVVIVYRDYDIYGLPSAVITYTGRASYSTHFAALREMNKVRSFHVVLCADVWDRVVVDAVRALEQAKAGCSDFFPEPLVISRLRGSSPTFTEENGGGH